TRVRHSVNQNSLKLYDKQGSVLRPECTINNTREFRIYRVRESDPDGPKSWQRLRKGVEDLPRRAEISHAACSRYLTALAEVDSKIPLGEVADAIRRPVLREKRRSRGLQPLSGLDAELAAILLRGEFALNGIRNRDIRERLPPDTTSATDQRRQSGQVSRLLRLFSEHALIRELSGTHRYHLTAEGRRRLPAFIIARHATTEKLTQLAS
ncbi:MAG TPA: hypothetical protein VK137_00645, partial [Planctomycetaceae bacterium]|nr:hypothetical protein [Planctomycetaceae bacterium]